LFSWQGDAILAAQSLKINAMLVLLAFKIAGDSVAK
jgi:hypothetical protein